MNTEHESIPELQLEIVEKEQTNSDKLRELEKKIDLVIEKIKEKKAITNGI